MPKDVITADLLRKLFNYDPASGWFSRYEGAMAGWINADGYRAVSVKNTTQYAHRVIWCMMTGEWPTQQIDHVNGDRSDNRWENLRAATVSENHQNRAKRSDNSSGEVGVRIRVGKTGTRYIAGIAMNGKTKHLGSFLDMESARNAYLAAKRELHQFNPVPRS